MMIPVPRRYYLNDHLGSTRAVVNDGGNVLETFDYYPFGLLMPKRHTAEANTMEKFTGKERDTEGNLNLDYFGARYYDAAIGRFPSVDPLASIFPGWAPYHYVHNNPLKFNDPTGMCAELINAPSGNYEGDSAQALFNEYCTEGETQSHIDPESGTNFAQNHSSCVGLTCGNSANYMPETETSKNLLGAAGYASGGIAGAQIGMIHYRKSLPLSSKIGTFSDFIRIYSRFGRYSKVLGAAGSLGMTLSFGVDGYDVYHGNLSPERFVYRTTGSLATVAVSAKIGMTVGGPYGMAAGAILGGSFVGGEYLYDHVLVPFGITVRDQFQRIQHEIHSFENHLKRGRYSGFWRR